MKFNHVFKMVLFGLLFLAGSAFAATRMVVCEETYKSG